MVSGWHEILEPDELVPLMASAKNGAFAVPILFWLKRELMMSPAWASRGLEVDVIGAGMAGYYPALGIRLLSWSPEASSTANEDVTRLARELLQQRPISDFLQFVAEDRSDWNAIYHDLIARQQPHNCPATTAHNRSVRRMNANFESRDSLAAS